MDDGQHVFVMQMSDGDLQPYPTSGLYAKNAPRSPIWRWQEPYLGSMIYKIYSYSGRFVVTVMPAERPDGSVQIRRRSIGQRAQRIPNFRWPYKSVFRIILRNGSTLAYRPTYDTLYLCGVDKSGARQSVSILDVDMMSVQVK